MKEKYPIKFICKTSGYKFKASCKIGYNGSDYVYWDVGDTLKEAVDSFIDAKLQTLHILMNVLKNLDHT